MDDLTSHGALYRAYFGRVALFGANFAIGKVAAYLGPLLLARYVASDIYGSIEYAWSVGLFAAAVLGAGIPSAVPPLSLLRRPIPLVDVVASAVALPGIIVLAGGIALWIGLGGPVAGLVAASTVLALAQSSLGTYCRTFSYRNWSAWVDGCATHAVAILALLLIVGAKLNIENLAASAIFVSFLVVVAAILIVVRTRQPGFRERAASMVVTGLPLLAYGLCSIWAVTSARIYMGTFLTAADVAIYSICFRVAGVILVFHMVLTVGLFARLYRMPTREYDRYCSIYQLVMAAICMALVALVPFIVPHVELRAVNPQDQSTIISLFPLVMLQMFASQAWAALEWRIGRARRAMQAAWRTVIVMVLVAAVIGALVALGALTLHIATGLVAVQMLAGPAIQLRVLWLRGLKMPKTLLAMALSVTLILALAILMA